MRQTFDVIGGAKIGRANLPRLRAEMRLLGMDGFFIPHDDEFQNEYLPAANERLAWATGFTGSAGAALVFQKFACLFVDGRYTLQAAMQVDSDLFEVADLIDPGPYEWLQTKRVSGLRIGYDPHVIAPDALDRLKAAAARAGAEVINSNTSPLDAAWTDRPEPPMAPIVPHDIAWSGQSSFEKREAIGKQIADQGVDAVILTSPASLAWLFNIRGGDVACSPLPLGRAILFADGTAELFVNRNKVSEKLSGHLGNEVALRPETELDRRLAKLNGRTVGLDPSQASAWFFATMDKAGAEVKRISDPCALPRARKNAVEVQGARNAHIRDGGALSRFLRWIDDEGATGNISEVDAAMRLESFRDETSELRDISFESISGAGPNGAVIHYRPNVDTNRKLQKGSLYLIDSGGQYLDGTTDVTRTIAIGEPTAEMVNRFTRVLKGHIALSRIRFPKGTTGSALDILARMSLWEAGLDYDHGTGHGVGSFLGVHEGPQRIAKAPNSVPLEPGMIVSNEPGYYKPGEYGIRIENLQVVTEPKAIPGGERPMMGFETLTLAPIDRRLIEPGMLTEQEWLWIDRYHARVLKEVGPLLSKDDLAWLEAACAPL
jgi:Xaa-Pro aminopeptidase